MIARLGLAALCLSCVVASAQEERPRKERSLTQTQEAERRQQQQGTPRPRDDGTRPGRTSSPKPPAAQSSQPVDRSPVRHCSARPHCLSADGLRNVCRSAELHYSGRQEGATDIVSRCQALNSPDPCGADMGAAGAAQRAAYSGGCFAQCARIASCVER